MWNKDKNHQKYDKIAIVWNVGISEDQENILEKIKQMKTS